MAAPYLFPPGASLGTDNVVLHARSRRHRVCNYAGPLSIKTVLDGQVAWTVAGRDLVVDRSSFLVLADGAAYSMDIDTMRPVETCCVFFSHGFVEGVALDATSPLEQSLDDPDRAAPALPFLSALHEDGERILLGRVQSLGQRCGGALAPSGFEEDFLVLAQALLRFYEGIREQAARVPAVRESTRQEIFRRLLKAREFLHSEDGPVSLDAAARAACLSRYHFHRAFTQAFRQTPHEYLTNLRLERARAMLKSGSKVVDACVGVGFQSASAFSRLFRTRYGESPSAERKR